MQIRELIYHIVPAASMLLLLTAREASSEKLFGRLKRAISEVTYHGKEPNSARDGAIEHLAENIDWLEHHIDLYGAVVAKQPDIWGEARLTKHRDEYEKVLFQELGNFEARINAAISQTDSSFLAQALALSNAAAGGEVTPPSSDAESMPTIAVAGAQTTGVDDIRASFDRFGVSETPNEPGVSLEPVVVLDQLSRYLQHLHELRRINEGDDTSDSPGYSLNLVRIPVSINPGKLTRTGFGAEITISASPVLSDDLLPTTFRNLVINDIVDQLGLVLVKTVENYETIMDTVDLHNRSFAFRRRVPEGTASLKSSAPTGQMRNSLLPLAPSTLLDVYWLENILTVADFYREAYDGRFVRWNGARPTTVSGQVNCAAVQEYRVDLMDARRFLRAELAAAYELLSDKEHLRLFSKLAEPDSGLAHAIRSGHFYDSDGKPSVQRYREYFFASLHDHANSVVQVESSEGFDSSVEFKEEVEFTVEQARQNSEGVGKKKTIAKYPVEALAWAVVVESALLNERLNRDVRTLASAKGVVGLQTDSDLSFFLPGSVMALDNGLEDVQAEFMGATHIFQEYVRARWPIHVFAIDPREQDQNVADVSQRKRELQFALALGFTTGKIGANSLTQFSRELETQVETISLNRTIVGFGHGSDTFGWRFHPRVQALDVPGTLGAIRETLAGASRDYDLRRRKLEPGQRECVAIVLMPSFVPYADFDIRTNWFKLTNPKNAAITMKRTMRMSRAVTAMRHSRAQCAQCQHLYRDGELARLFRRVDQLDRELPLQTLRSQVPYENTLGGFEMFNTGVTDLGPELIGWYGAPGIVICNSGANVFACGCASPCDSGSQPLTVTSDDDGRRTAQPFPVCEGQGTSVFLVGNNFSVHDTKIIAGGVCIPHVQLISREIMRVTIPSCVNTVKLCENGVENDYVSVYVATPYGITNHLHIPVAACNATTTEASSEEARPPTPAIGDARALDNRRLMVRLPDPPDEVKHVTFLQPEAESDEPNLLTPLGRLPEEIPTNPRSTNESSPSANNSQGGTVTERAAVALSVTVQPPRISTTIQNGPSLRKQRLPGGSATNRIRTQIGERWRNLRDRLPAN